MFDAGMFHLKMSVKTMNKEFCSNKCAHLYAYQTIEAMESEKVEFP